MHLKPANVDELANLLACAYERGEKISSVDLSLLNRVLEHKAEDMTATIEAGAILNVVQQELGRRKQWLPIDPPHPARLFLSDLLSRNLSGPRRFGYGTVGDYLIGIKVVLADGRIISPGGKVVKNVAGYDLAKLFIGGHGTLGIIAEATFKLRPLSESEKVVQKQCASVDDAKQLIDSVLDSELTPTIFDLHNLSSGYTAVLGFAGTNEEVEWQLRKARELGISASGTLAYDEEFWAGDQTFSRFSARPSKITESIAELKNAPFLARAGNGIIYHRGALPLAKRDLPVKLFDRLKNEFDPKHILPELVL